MPKNCLLPSQAEKLKEEFRNKNITLEEVYNMSSGDRVKFFEKYLGNSSVVFVAKLEKAFLSPNQKKSIKNVIEKEVGQRGQLYKIVSLEEAKNMAKDLSIDKLKKMSPTERLAEFKKYVGDGAVSLNDKFEYARKSGDFANFEKRAFGTEALAEEKKLKRDFARLETLNAIGVLNPEQLKDFMQTYIESKLDVSINFEESNKLSELITKQSETFNALKKSGNWVNSEISMEYWLAADALKRYTETLSKKPSAESIGNNLIEIGRNNILGSVFTGINSFLYQLVPSIKTKLASGLNPITLFKEGKITDKLINKVDSLFLGKEGRAFVREQIKFGLDIYDKTNIDTSRMYTLEDGYRYFGEKEVGKALPNKGFSKAFKERVWQPIKEAKGLKAKLFSMTEGYKNLTSVLPKYMAGGTDTFVAQGMRASTSYLLAKEIVNYKYVQGIETDVTKKEQLIKELVSDSYNPFTKNKDALVIRDRAILDAHNANNTQPEALSEFSMEIRNKVKPFGLNIGRNFIPYLKIPTTVVSESIQTATGIGVGKEIRNIISATKETDEVVKAQKIGNSTTKLIGYLGVTASALLLSAILDDDDYIPPYMILKSDRSGYSFAESQGAKPGSVRINGTWIPLKYMPGLNIILGSIMFGRQAKSEDGETFIFNYFRGIVAETLGLPVIDNFYRFIDKTGRSMNKKNFKDYLDNQKLGGSDLWDYTKIRALPSMISRDLYKALFNETKYDFLGNDIEKGKIFSKDKTTDTILEYRRLDNAGFMPTISDPTTDAAKKIKADRGEEAYEELLAELKRDYRDKVEKLMSGGRYERKDDEKKKELIDDERKDEILKPLRDIAKRLK